MVFYFFQRRRQDGFIIGGADRRLFQIDIQAVEAIDFHQANNLVFQLVFVAGFQLDMRVCAAEGDQHRAALAVQHAYLAAKLGVGQVVRFEGRDALAFHKGDGHHVVLGGNVGQVHIGELALLIAVTDAGGPVVPETHQDLFIGDRRHNGRVIGGDGINNVICAHGSLIH